MVKAKTPPFFATRRTSEKQRSQIANEVQHATAHHMVKKTLFKGDGLLGHIEEPKRIGKPLRFTGGEHLLRGIKPMHLEADLGKLLRGQPRADADIQQPLAGFDVLEPHAEKHVMAVAVIGLDLLIIVGGEFSIIGLFHWHI